jgi:hypothetical protein
MICTLQQLHERYGRGADLRALKDELAALGIHPLRVDVLDFRKTEYAAEPAIARLVQVRKAELDREQRERVTSAIAAIDAAAAEIYRCRTVENYPGQRFRT